MIELFNGDCLEVMPEIESGSIDLTVTSPPYDNLRSYNGSLEWSSLIWKAIIKELYRVTKSGGVVVWVVGDATINGSETGTSFKQALFFMECGFNLHDTMIYKKSGCPFPETTRYYPNFEYMFVLSKSTPKTINLIKDRKNSCSGAKKNRLNGTGDRQADGTIKKMSCDKLMIDKRIKDIGVRYNIWEIPHTDGSRSLGHPATFPIDLAESHIYSWSEENDVVLDIFMGSGTVGVASNKLNRRFIGIEKEKEYFDIAEMRIAEETAQQVMEL